MLGYILIDRGVRILSCSRKKITTIYTHQPRAYRVNQKETIMSKNTNTLTAEQKAEKAILLKETAEKFDKALTETPVAKAVITPAKEAVVETQTAEVTAETEKQAVIVSQALILLELIKTETGAELESAKAKLATMVAEMDDATKVLYIQAQDKLAQFGKVVVLFGKVAVLNLILGNVTNTTTQILFLGENLIKNTEVLTSSVVNVVFNTTYILRNLLKQTGKVTDEFTKWFNEVADGNPNASFRAEVFGELANTVGESVLDAGKSAIGIIGTALSCVSDIFGGVSDSLKSVADHNAKAIGRIQVSPKQDATSKK